MSKNLPEEPISPTTLSYIRHMGGTWAAYRNQSPGHPRYLQSEIIQVQHPLPDTLPDNPEGWGFGGVWVFHALVDPLRGVLTPLPYPLAAAHVATPPRAP